MTIHRFHVPGVRAGAMELPDATRVHATRVLRLKEGSALRVFDCGEEFAATITAILKHRVLIQVGAALTPLPERLIPMHLLMSPLKGDLTELVIQKTTELGVARISPVVFERTDTMARPDPSPARLDRWRRVAASAAEQSGRATVPNLDPVMPVAQAMKAFGPQPEREVRVIAAEPSLALKAREWPAGASSLVVAVGPSGGLSPGDLESLHGAGFLPAEFAVHTLRSETACVAAIAILGDRFR